MKLLFCPSCHDIFKLQALFKACICKESHGRYTDDLNAEIGGKGIPIGIDNQSFVNAIRGRKQEGKGTSFDAFVIPFNCKTVKDLENI